MQGPVCSGPCAVGTDHEFMKPTLVIFFYKHLYAYQNVMEMHMKFKVPAPQIHALHLEMTSTALPEGAGPGAYVCVRSLYMWLQVIAPECSI